MVTLNLPVDDETRKWLRALVEFLIGRGILQRDHIPRFLKFFSKLDRRVGQLAIMKGYLALPDVLAILTNQGESDTPFGELAVRSKRMTQAQLEEILTLQRSRMKLFLESLVMLGVLKRERVPAIIQDFRSSLEKGALTADEAGPVRTPAGDRIRKVLRKIQSLGTLSSSIQRLLTVTEDPECDLKQVGEVITSDPAMTMQLLRIANSVVMAVSRRITNISEAVNRVGIKGIRNLAFALVVVDKFKGVGAKKARGIWLHSVLAGEWAGVLGKMRGIFACYAPRRADNTPTVSALPAMGGNFVKLQAEPEILDCLRAIEGHSRARDLVFQKVAKQLDSRTLDNAAFSFLLMEMLHRFEWALGEDAGQFLPKCILALTGDSDLAKSARKAYNELGPADDEKAPAI